MFRIFIDGSVGTTGLRIVQRLSERGNLELLTLDEQDRKDLNKRVEIANKADLVFLCLPDVAAKEIAQKLNSNVKICDTSTAHRVNDEWTYGFAEIADRREKLKVSTKTAVPGCHASGFIALVTPLIEKGLLDKTTRVTATSITGYSGGGKSMIAQYESEERDEKLASPRTYGLTLKHKHLPEMCKVTGLENSPIFMPIVADYYSGMCVNIPIFVENLLGDTNAQDVYTCISEYYKDEKAISVMPFNELPDDGFMAANELSFKDSMKLYVYSNGEQILLSAVYDNLGKGASGAAIQCMNIMLGLDEYEGLEL